jgi:predicted small integral membrane protein
VTIFCAIGILASVGLLRDLWRRYFAEVGVGVVVACALALGLATGVPTMLPRSEVHEVAVSCGYMLTMLALAAIWCALHEPELRKRSGWLAAASVAYGLAVGARPSLLFGAVILLVPVTQAWREPRPEGLPRSAWLSGLLAATGPILLIGLGLMLYNALRFDNPFEFDR